MAIHDGLGSSEALDQIGRTATVAELVLGVLLLAGLWPRWTALSSALLLILFGTAMAISFGAKSPLDYSVFSASAAAVLLAFNQPGTQSN